MTPCQTLIPVRRRKPRSTPCSTNSASGRKRPSTPPSSPSRKAGFLKDRKGRLFLVTARESARIDLKRLHEPLGAAGRLSFGGADLLRETLGVEPGSVTAFAVINDAAGRVRMALDAGLMAEAVIYGHPLRNTATVAIARDDLLRVLRATGHDPLIVALPEPSAADGAPD